MKGQMAGEAADPAESFKFATVFVDSFEGREPRITPCGW